ncbi:MAG TPA: 30S ribosomal protein S21 [Phycisphaerales bacterium]|nr:30S ribosomal protein S21 [Phycisphaerales bacterium]
MAIRLKARQNESVGQLMRRFKKLCEKEGLVKEVKKRQYYEKPSERKRRDSRRNIARTIKPGEMSRGGSGRGSSGPGRGGMSRDGGGSKRPSRDM